MLGPITRLIERPVPELLRIMASAMLSKAKRDQGRTLRAKRQISFDGLEKAQPRSRSAVTSPLAIEADDPPGPLVTPPARDRGIIYRTSTPNDSGHVSEDDKVPSYEAVLREQFSPITSPTLVPSILSSVDEDPIMAARKDVQLTELKPAPVEAPAAASLSEAGPSGVSLPPIFPVPPPNLYLNVTNAPVGSTLVPRATIDTPCSRICMLVPAQYGGIVQREDGADPVTNITATGFQITATRNYIEWSGAIPAPSTRFVGPTYVDPMSRANGFAQMY